jgi:hypothetical protein
MKIQGSKAKVTGKGVKDGEKTEETGLILPGVCGIKSPDSDMHLKVLWDKIWVRRWSFTLGEISTSSFWIWLGLSSRVLFLSNYSYAAKLL